MSFSYDRYETQRRRQTYGASSRRTALGYWVPLALTVTVATIGLAAWIWSERKDGDDDEYDRWGDRPPKPPPGYGDPRPGETVYARGAESAQVEDASVMARMSGALRRTPSPQQLFDGASRRVVAGVAAAGAVVGGALSSIKEEDKRDFEDHSRWSEEAESRNETRITREEIILRDAERSSTNAPPSRQIVEAARLGDKRKAVAIVVSAETRHHGPTDDDVAYHQEHASILSHLPEHVDADSRVFVLIYEPELKKHPLAMPSQQSRPTASLTSSYSNIGPEDVQTPGEEVDKPLSSVDPNVTAQSGSKMFNAMYAEARTIAEKETMIMPFTTPTGHIHLLRHLAPEVVYLQENMSGPGGDAVSQISGWVGQIVLVVGDESGHGGLVDSEDERGALGEEIREKWWQSDPRIGLGKGVEVVDGLRVGEDWRRRVRGHD